MIGFLYKRGGSGLGFDFGKGKEGKDWEKEVLERVGKRAWKGVIGGFGH